MLAVRVINQSCRKRLSVDDCRCSCLDGFTLATDARSCNDIDECLLEQDDCDSLAMCSNTAGSYNCTCINGTPHIHCVLLMYRHTSSTGHALKKPIGPCKALFSSHLTLTYIWLYAPARVSFWAITHRHKIPGYCSSIMALLIVDCELLIVDCWLPIAGCWLLFADWWLLIVDCWLPIADCWLIASLSLPGYTGQGAVGNCLDIDECSADPDMCPENSQCVDTLGSYECVCYFGYKMDAGTCSNINECLFDNLCQQARVLTTASAYQIAQSINLSIYQSINLSINQFINQSIDQSIDLSIDLSINILIDIKVRKHSIAHIIS